MTPASHGSASSSVVITTKNRLGELRKAVASAVMQTAQPQIVVIDDGSTDGTAEAVAREFPQAQLHHSETSLGYVVQRNRGAALAAAPIVFSIDDDAVFSSPFVIEQTLREFDHPRVGAVAIPFVDVNQSPEVHHRAPASEGIYARYCYIGTAHALRRGLFLQLSGYREGLVHQSEEEDYCLRLLEAGYITRCGTADPVHHFESPRRNYQRMDYYGARNKVLYAWSNVPAPQVAGHLAVTTVKTLLFSLRPDRFLTRLGGVIAACQLCLRGRAPRQPVSATTYRVSRLLKARGAVRLAEIEAFLPPPRFI